MDYSRHYYMDGIDLWTYGVVVSKGVEDFLQFPQRKEPLSHDWPDQNGTDVDLSSAYLQSRTINLQCNLLAETVDQFWVRYKNLLTNLMRPGPRRIEVSALGQRDYTCYYKEMNAFQQPTKISEASPIIGSKFTLSFIEHEPKQDNGQIFLVTEEGHFLVT